ncbi:MAG: DUF1573 domain-containing protein [Prevotella sp.]|nr:DUF1573 domain-containing protein [Prevotella sp.]
MMRFSMLVRLVLLMLLLFNCQCSERKQQVPSQVESQTDSDVVSDDHDLVEESDSSSLIQFDDLDCDLGVLARSKNPVASYSFGFANVGDAPLVILSADGYCDCTVVEYPHDSIMPGSRGTIDVTYDSRIGNLGIFHKNVEVQYNGSDKPVILTLSGRCTK